MPTSLTTMVQACLLILAGGFAAQHSRVIPSSDLCLGLFVAVILLFVVRRVRWFAFVLLGFTLFLQSSGRIIDGRLDAQFAGESLLTEVRVIDFPKSSGQSVSMVIEAVADERLPGRSRVTWFDPPTLPAIGEIWELELRLRRPRGNSNPGGFSLEDWMFRERLQAGGYVVPGKRNRLIAEGELPAVDAYRRDFVVRVRRDGGSAAPALAAIGVGARHLLTREQWDRYAKTGTSHLMAISGLHVGLAAGAAFAVIALMSGVCRLRGSHLDRATIAATVMAALYATVAGFAVPSQRATFMLALAASAFLLRRRTDATRIVAIVALLVFVFDPVALLAPGFSLSFAAVVALLWFGRRYSRPFPGHRLLSLVPMQFVLLLGLMPLTVLIYHRIAFAAPATNLVAVPVFSLVTVPLLLASMVLEPVWLMASVNLLKASAASIVAVEYVIAQMANVSFTDATIAGVDRSILTIVMLPALWVALPRGWPGRWVAILAVAALCLNKPQAPPKDCIDAHVLDVGQGLSVVVQTARHVLIFDTGASYRGGGSAFTRLVLPFLRHRGIDRIDWLVVSHADDDHAGGARDLLQSFDVSTIWVGEPLPGTLQSQVRCAADTVWQVDGVEFRFLHPGSQSKLSGNDASCVLSVSTGEYRLLLTGDIEVDAERDIVRETTFIAASVVVVPHHGSLTSSSPAFVNRLHPALAIASAGHGNRWGFPKERVVARWQGAGATFLDTASSGAIGLRLCTKGGMSRLKRERNQRHRYWHDSATL